MIGNQVSINVDRWLKEGNIDKIEKLLLKGRSHLLEGKETMVTNPKTANFLSILPAYKVR